MIYKLRKDINFYTDDLYVYIALTNNYLQIKLYYKMKGINKFISKELTTSEANTLKGGVFCEWVVGKSGNMKAANSMKADATARGDLNASK